MKLYSSVILVLSTACCIYLYISRVCHVERFIGRDQNLYCLTELKSAVPVMVYGFFLSSYGDECITTFQPTSFSLKKSRSCF